MQSCVDHKEKPNLNMNGVWQKELDKQSAHQIGDNFLLLKTCQNNEAILANLRFLTTKTFSNKSAESIASPVSDKSSMLQDYFYPPVTAGV
jgi:hypothetical protein